MLLKAQWKIALALAGVLAIGAFAYPSTRARLQVIGLKVEGRLPTVSWKQILRIMGRGPAAIDLAASANPFASLTNPHEFSAERQRRSKEVFDRQCASCHGQTASGGMGPSLVGREFTHGDSDWALFLAIDRGIAGTAMRPSGLSESDDWGLVSYLRELDVQSRVGSILADVQSTGDHAVTYQMLRGASGETKDWLLPSGTYDSQRFSNDQKIDTNNVEHLSVRWIYQFGTKDALIGTIPLVVNGRMYVTLPTGTVIALDAASGARIWQYVRPLPSDLVLCCPANRGVAVLGDKVYVGTLDAHLLALDANSGKVLWDQTVANYREGHAITSAPLALNGLVVTGIAGGDFPTRGFISAYNAQTGALRWRVKSIPEPGEPGNETWGGDSWRTGGVATWMTGSYDPVLDLLYWGTGNPAPDYNADSRPGDNLYSNSVLAINASTGKLEWYFQFTPGDDHDWDSVQTPILIDGKEGGVLRKLLVVANRNGFFYVLDRETGEFLRAAPYARQTWAIGMTPEGRPIRSPHASPTVRGTRLFPGMTGATNSVKSAYSPQTQLYYVPVLERGGVYFLNSEPPSPRLDQQFLGGTVLHSEDYFMAVRAIDPVTAKVRWERKHTVGRVVDNRMGGLLVTAGGLLFGSDRSRFIALNSQDGTELFSFEAGGLIVAAPVTYRAGGDQYVAVAAGDALLSFGLKGSRDR